MFYICCCVWKIEASIGQFMVHFFYNAHSKKKKPLDTGLSDTSSNWQHTILICGEWQGGLSKGVGVIQENGRKRYLKRWKGEEKLLSKYKHFSDVFAHTQGNRGVKGLAGSKAGNRRQNILTTLSPQFVCHSSFHVTTLSKYHLADTQIYKYGITGKFLYINNN